MKAFYATKYGGPEVMRLGDLPDPKPGTGEVLLRVHASSVNPVDWKLRAGQAKLVTGWRFPKVFGADFAGVVEACGPSVSKPAIGEPVYGYRSLIRSGHGGHAELVTVAAGQVHPLPSGLGFEQAASLPVAALTALNGLRMCGDLGGADVIVNGATGGVGHFATQIARARRASVTAVCSAKNGHRAEALGATKVIDYATEDFTSGHERYDVVFDAYAHLGFGQAQRALTDEGRYVTPLPTPRVVMQALWRRLVGGKQIVLSNVRSQDEDYAELARLIESGYVMPIAEHVFPLAESADAFALLERGGVVGKVVIRMT